MGRGQRGSRRCECVCTMHVLCVSCVGRLASTHPLRVRGTAEATLVCLLGVPPPILSGKLVAGSRYVWVWRGAGSTMGAAEGRWVVVVGQGEGTAAECGSSKRVGLQAKRSRPNRGQQGERRHRMKGACVLKGMVRGERQAWRCVCRRYGAVRAPTAHARMNLDGNSRTESSRAAGSSRGTCSGGPLRAKRERNNNS